MRFLLPMLVLCSACYRYAAVEMDALSPGQGVRARINAASAEQVEPLLGVSDARLLSGKVVSSSGDTIIVEVPTTVRAELSGTVQTLNQRVALPRTAILELESRSLDPGRTAIVVGAVAAGATFALVKAIRGEPGGSRGPDGGGPADLRTP